MIDRIHLNIVLEVERQGSLTAAAKTLFVTQSALSHTVRKLEDRLGTPIWLREGRNLRLTQAGIQLYELAKHIIPQIEHTELRLQQISTGKRGSLRIGMECHPCYQWLLKTVAPYLEKWTDIDVDVKQKFQFGGLTALQEYDVDILVTPDPVYQEGLTFEPVFDYEQVLVVNSKHKLAKYDFIEAKDLQSEILITYPVPTDRLDVFNQFLMPAGMIVKQHKTIETTDIMLQMVASGRGVAALPRWLVLEYAPRLDVIPVRLGKNGISKQIHLGVRNIDLQLEYVNAFVQMSRLNN